MMSRYFVLKGLYLFLEASVEATQSVSDRLGSSVYLFASFMFWGAIKSLSTDLQIYEME